MFLFYIDLFNYRPTKKGSI